MRRRSEIHPKFRLIIPSESFEDEYDIETDENYLKVIPECNNSRKIL